MKAYTCLAQVAGPSPAMCAYARAGLKGGIYIFDPEVTPQQVFSRFFGTANPYEALDGELKEGIPCIISMHTMRCLSPPPAAFSWLRAA